MNTTSSIPQTREQCAAIDIIKSINRGPITRQAVEEILITHRIFISHEKTRAEMTHLLINMGTASPDRHAVIMYINGEENALPAVADAMKRENSTSVFTVVSRDQECKNLHTDAPKPKVEPGIYQPEVLFDSEHSDIGECVVSFRHWMHNVFNNVKRKSYPPRLRHTRFEVPKRFRRTIAAPQYVEVDEDGMFFYKGLPIVIF